MRPHAIAAAIALSAIVLAGCGDELRTTTGPGNDPPDRTRVESAGGGGEELAKPPPVVVTYGEKTLTLEAWVWCWENGCVDGVPPEDLEELGPVDGPISVESPISGWEFEATFINAETMNPDKMCDWQTIPAIVEPAVDHWTVTPQGPAGTYRVELSGHGKGGDATVSFLVTTTKDHPWPAVSAGADTYYFESEPDESGAEPATFAFNLSVQHVTANPKNATASVHLTGPNGEQEVGLSPIGCQTEGTISFEAEPKAEPIIDKIGEPPYQLRFELELDGVRHVATAGWPPYDDAPKGYPEHATLEFDPPLPGH